MPNQPVSSNIPARLPRKADDTTNETMKRFRTQPVMPESGETEAGEEPEES